MITQFKIFESLNNNFWKWFDNSKIVENGKPLICYHGTSESKIKYFDINNVDLIKIKVEAEVIDYVFDNQENLFLLYNNTYLPP